MRMVLCLQQVALSINFTLVSVSPLFDGIRTLADTEPSGHIFACTVQLGGQLTSTKSASSFASTKDEQKKDAMQAAVAASIESKWVSASASYSKGKTDESSSHAANTDSSSALAWNARGGNTLLCAK